MPVNKNAIIRYQALDKCFSNWGRKYYIDDLVEACNKALYEYNGNTKGIKRRQIYNDIKFMESEQGYSIPLERIKDDKRVYYRYSDRNFSINNRIINETEANQLKETLLNIKKFKGLPNFEWVDEMLLRLETILKIKKTERHIVEFQQNPYLKGLEHFGTLFNAIIYKKVLKIKYKSYKQDKPELEKIHPYFLKQYNNRWFLFGHNPKWKNLSNMALDRIHEIKEVKAKYIENQRIDFEEYFDDVVGVTVRDVSPEKIILKIKNQRFPYIESKPLHGSQIIIKKDENWVSLEYNLQINNELIALILSYGDDIIVVKPDDLKEIIKSKAVNILKNYF